MTSIAAKRRAKKASRVISAATYPLAQPAAKPSTEATVSRFREKTGLEWLESKNKITARQKSSGKRYGEDYRIVQVAGLEPLRSCLNDMPGGGDGGGGLSLATYELEAKERLAGAHSALSYHPEMTLACDLICGRDMTPWEVIARHGGNQRDAERLQHTLRIALDLLAKHYSLTN